MYHSRIFQKLLGIILEARDRRESRGGTRDSRLACTGYLPTHIVFRFHTYCKVHSELAITCNSFTLMHVDIGLISSIETIIPSRAYMALRSAIRIFSQRHINIVEFLEPGRRFLWTIGYLVFDTHSSFSLRISIRILYKRH